MNDIVQISETVDFSNEKIEKIIKEFQEKFKQKVTVQSVTDAVITLMNIMGKFSKVSGQDKKFIVTKVLIHIVKESNKGEESDTILENILINIIPILIDRLISVEKGKIILNKKASLQIKRCFPCLF